VRKHKVDLRLGVAVSALARVEDKLEATIGDSAENFDAVIVAGGVRGGFDVARRGRAP